MLISKETLEGIRIGELTDDQLEKSIEHYTLLENLLKCHEEKYHLVWKDVHSNLITLKSYELAREREKNRNNEARNNQT